MSLVSYSYELQLHIPGQMLSHCIYPVLYHIPEHLEGRAMYHFHPDTDSLHP